MSPVSAPYHHGDLASACVQAAIELLEENGVEALSLRAVARRIGVSPAAPYRHYRDKEALISAIAVVGYRDLAHHLFSTCPAPASITELAESGVAYVQFSLHKPALFRIMFTRPCQQDSSNEERRQAVAMVAHYLCASVQRCFPFHDQTTSEAIAHGIWGLVHGLAMLHLDGKFDSTDSHQINQHVTTSIIAVLTAQHKEAS